MFAKVSELIIQMPQERPWHLLIITGGQDMVGDFLPWLYPKTEKEMHHTDMHDMHLKELKSSILNAYYI